MPPFLGVLDFKELAAALCSDTLDGKKGSGADLTCAVVCG